MGIQSLDILNSLSNDTLNSNSVTIDFANKKIYITANRENIDSIKTIMNQQGFDYVGETIKLQYDHKQEQSS
jgi:hypothetical protein